jgi:hypothetical protein
MITQILKGDCEELCQEAVELLKNGFVKKALYKYEESFVIFFLFSFFSGNLVVGCMAWLSVTT